MSPSNYPPTDPDYSVPPVRYEPKSIEEVERMRNGRGPTTKANAGDRNIEAHHRKQKSTANGGILMIWKSMLIEGVETISAIRSLQSLHRSKGQKK